MKIIGKIIVLILAAFGAFVVALALSSGDVHACPYPDANDPRNLACAPATTTTPETTSTTTTTTVAPAVESTVVVTSLVPEGDVPGRSKCAPGEYRQSYAPDAPCGPTDPCLEEGATLWQVAPCGPEVAVGGGVLPKTGSDELVIALCALGFTLVGSSLVLARRV